MKVLTDTHTLVWALSDPEALGALARAGLDRILVAQALAERLTLATKDAIFARYGVPVVWE